MTFFILAANALILLALVLALAARCEWLPMLSVTDGYRIAGVALLLAYVFIGSAGVGALMEWWQGPT